jgi:HK97 family phage prohead protease
MTGAAAAPRTVMTTEAFRAKPTAGATIRTVSAAAVERNDDRTFTFVCAGGGENRNGWRINPDGWDLEAYQKNPVFLWAHDERSLPIGRALDVWVAGRQLKAKVEFSPEGVNPFADAACKLVAGGFLNAVSVGFGPTEWRWLEQGGGKPAVLEFTRVELWEISLVAVPADRNALLIGQGSAKGGRGSRAWVRRELELLGLESRLASQKVVRRAARRRELDLLLKRGR